MPKAFPSERRRDVVAVAGKTEAPTAHIAKDLVRCRFRMKASLAGAALRNAATTCTPGSRSRPGRGPDSPSPTTSRCSTTRSACTRRSATAPPPRPCPGHRRPPRGVDQPGAPVQDPWHTPRRRQDGVGCVRACRRSMSVWRSSPGVRDRPPVPAIWPKISPSRRATNTGACAAGSGAPAATSIFTARS